MTLRSRSRIAWTTAALSTLLPGSAIAQCAMCGTAIQSSADPLARGLFWSVLFLISLPYAIVGAFILGIAWMYRRARLRRERAALHLVGGRMTLATGKKEN